MKILFWSIFAIINEKHPNVWSSLGIENRLLVIVVKWILFNQILAACGIPFQVLPDYIEGAEQVPYFTNFPFSTYVNSTHS